MVTGGARPPDAPGGRSGDRPRRMPADAAPHRSLAGEVVHRAPAAARARWPILLGAIVAVLVVAAVVGIRLAATGGSAASPGDGPAATAAPGSAPARPSEPAPDRQDPSPAPSTRLPSALPEAVSGLTEARRQVETFVTALNSGDMDAANKLLCSAMIGGYGPHSLDGILPGSLSVGGVRVDGAKGSAVVLYQPLGSDSASAGRSVYDLIVEDGQWRLCTSS